MNKLNKEQQVAKIIKDLDTIYSTDFKGDYESGLVDIAERLYEADYRKTQDVVCEILEDVMCAIENGVAEANKLITDSTSQLSDMLIGTGEMYAGHIGKAIVDVFRKYGNEDRK
jgi:hypothetical protein